MEENGTSFFEGIIIRKGGFLRGHYVTAFRSEDESEAERKARHAAMKDMTDKAPMSLYEYCALEKGVTLRDIFLLCNKHREFFSQVFGYCYFEELLDYGLNAPTVETPAQGVSFGEDNQSFQRLQIDRSISIEYGYVYPEDVIFKCGILGKDEEYSSHIHSKGDVKEESIEISYDFSGKSFPLTQEKIDAMDCPAHYKVGEEISLGFFGHDIEKLMDIPLVINAQIQLHEQEKNGYQSGYEMRTVQSKNHIKFGEMLNTIFCEISFHGTPTMSREVETDLRLRCIEADEEIEKRRKENQNLENHED